MIEYLKNRKSIEQDVMKYLKDRIMHNCEQCITVNNGHFIHHYLGYHFQMALGSTTCLQVGHAWCPGTSSDSCDRDLRNSLKMFELNNNPGDGADMVISLGVKAWGCESITCLLVRHAWYPGASMTRVTWAQEFLMTLR